MVELPFRFPVQYVNRPNLDFRGFAGTIASGSVAQGDEVVVAKSGKSSRVKRIVSYGGDLAQAAAGQAVTLVLDDEVEISRGNMLVSPAHGRRSPTSSPPTSSGSTSMRCCPAAPTSCAPRPTRPAPPSPT
jgi:sulfate adenylyltransferase subunit 1 (EFTu-like GTPase family)